jgi:uncharacterized membrane protein
MGNFLLKFLVVGSIMALLDYLWLSKIATGFYLSQLNQLAIVEDGNFKPILWAAVIVYLCLAIGVTVFCLPLSKSILSAIYIGAAFGFVVYGVYDMTNLALVKDWPIKMSFVDMAWGTFLCGTTNGVSYWIVSKMGW